MDLNKNDYYLEFNGFESGLYLYINNKFVGYSSFNFENIKFKINDFLKKGVNRLTFLVFKYSFTSYLKDQDMWRFFGIFRDVNLIKVNKLHFLDIKNDSILSNEDYETGLLNLTFTLSSFNKDSSISLSLNYKNKKIFTYSNLQTPSFRCIPAFLPAWVP